MSTNRMTVTRKTADRPYACRKCCDTGIVMSDGERRYCRCEAGRELYRKRCQECDDD